MSEREPKREWFEQIAVLAAAAQEARELLEQSEVEVSAEGIAEAERRIERFAQVSDAFPA